MKNNICLCALLLACAGALFAQEAEASKGVVPAARRPKKPTAAQILASTETDESHNTDEYVQKCNDTFSFGLESEISTLIDELTQNEDMRFVDKIYDLFQVTKSPAIKQEIIAYFTKLKDPCLEDFAVTVINDPYDERKETVNACFKYVSAVDCKEAVPGVKTLIDKEDENYFDGALSCLGDIGGTDEALFLTDYLEREDLTTAQKQSLMKVLGKIKAVETWDKLAEIAQNEDENAFVRMYAAEAIGAMEKPESEPILIKLYEQDDPNFRVYVIKGLSHFKDKNADDVIVQALRDSHYKVRLEAVNTVKDRKMEQAVPYLVYRCKDKSESDAVKVACYDTLALLNTKEGNDYLVKQITDAKVGDSTKSKIATYLLQYDHAGTDEILALASESIKDDTKKNLRYALGKEFAKYGRSAYKQICAEYIASKDVSTQGIGLDIFAKGRYSSVRKDVESIAALDEDAIKKEAEEQKTAASQKKSDAKQTPVVKKTPNANAKKAKRILLQIDSLYGTQQDVSEQPAAEPSSEMLEK